jgi:hypothetical protein
VGIVVGRETAATTVDATKTANGVKVVPFDRGRKRRGFKRPSLARGNVVVVPPALVVVSDGGGGASITEGAKRQKETETTSRSKLDSLIV